MKTIMNQSKASFLYKASLILTLGLLLFSNPIQAEEYKQDYTGSAKVKETDLIDLQTSHCKSMIITTTDNNTASYKITVIIEGSDKDFAKQIFDEVSYEIENKNDGIKMNLDWPFKSYSSNSSLFGDKTTITMNNGTKFSYSGKLKVKMIAEVSIPKKNMLELKGRHSTLQLGHMSNSVDLDIRHSKLKTNDMKSTKIDAAHSSVNIGNIAAASNISLSHSKLNGLKINDASIVLSHSKLSLIETGNTSINLSHSNADIDKGGNIAVGSLSHSDLEMNSAGNVVVSSMQHSDIEIDKAANVLVKNGQHGKIEIEELVGFEFQSGGFTSIHIGTVTQKLNIDTRHSGLVIENFAPGVKNVEIENEFASVTLGTANIANLNLYVNDGKHTTVNNGSSIEKKSDGYYKKGGDSGNMLELKITCPHCTINVE